MKIKPNDPVLVSLSVALITLAILLLLSAKSQMGSDFSDGNDTQRMLEKTALFPKAPELSGIAGYINAPEGFRLSDVKGKVVLIDFWTYSCINCIRTLPYLEAWDERYRDKGLVIIGVHSPEFGFEQEYANVKAAVEKYGIKYPVVLDNSFSTWRSFGNRYWPHKYLIDSDGFIRYDHIGEGGYEETERQIQKLLAERDAKIEMGGLVAENITSGVDFAGIGTPEIYFGYSLAPGRDYFGSPEGFQPGKTVSYSVPPDVRPNLAYLEGNWTNYPDYMELASDTGRIVLRYQAKDVNLVAGQAADLEIKIDGEPASASEIGADGRLDGGRALVETGEHRLYNVVADEGYFQKTVDIGVSGKGFRIYTFTFG